MSNETQNTDAPAPLAMPELVGPEFLAPLLQRTVRTIKVDLTRKPESLPPRLVIPGSTRLLWAKQDVIDWLHGCRVANGAQPPRKHATRTGRPPSIIRRKAQSKL